MSSTDPTPTRHPAPDRPRTEAVDNLNLTDSRAGDSEPGRSPRTLPPTPGTEPRRAIVVGIDGSDEAAAAVGWAVEQAGRMGAVIRAVAVWQQPLQFGVSAVPPPRKEFEAEARRWLAHALPALGPDEPGAEIHTQTEEGDPSSVLLEQAADADLLVLGNHGRGALTGAFVGSVAQRCAHRAPCPVVLVPRPEVDPARSAGSR